MNGGDLQRIREELGLGRTEFARVLGFNGNSQTEARRMTRLETGRVPLTNDIVHRVLRLQRRRLAKLREGL